jgi:hypothetical protein
MCITYAHGHGTRGTIGYMLGIDATALCASASKVLRGCSHRRTPALDSNLDRSENAQRECPEPEMKPGGQIHSLTPGSIIANTPCLTQHANRVKGLLSRAKRNPETLTIQLLIKLASSHLILISFSSHSHLILISFSSHSHLILISFSSLIFLVALDHFVRHGKLDESIKRGYEDGQKVR